MTVPVMKQEDNSTMVYAERRMWTEHVRSNVGGMWVPCLAAALAAVDGVAVGAMLAAGESASAGADVSQ